MASEKEQASAAAGGLARVRHYHRYVFEFAKDALGSDDLGALLQHATECVSQGTGVARTKVLRYRGETADLLMVAGVGWKPGVVGKATLPTGMRSPPGRTVETGASVRIDDLPHNPDFDHSDLLRDHGICSLINVPIAVDGAVWGVLEIDSTEVHHFDNEDENFLSGFAEIIGRAIENQSRKHEAADARATLSIELREREVLFNELLHRTANQLMGITGLLEIARRRVVDQAAAMEFEKIVDRIAAVSISNEQLSLSQIERHISLGNYLVRVCEGMTRPDTVAITHNVQEAEVPLRIAVRLGLVANELVTNAVKHAFGASVGRITVTFRIDGDDGVLIVADDGHGIIARNRKGGSGTTLVASLVEQIGGTMTVASGGSGTCVTVKFRLSQSTESVPTPHNPA
jgi:two-component system, sensor histidine kinase PdtaS